MSEVGLCETEKWTEMGDTMEVFQAGEPDVTNVKDFINTKKC